MSTKAEIIEEIKVLDPAFDAKVDDFNHAELTAILEDEQGKAAPDDENLDDLVEELAKKPGVYVRAGKSITSKKGILNEGSGPFEPSLFGGKENIKRLVGLGCLEIVK